MHGLSRWKGWRRVQKVVWREDGYSLRVLDTLHFLLIAYFGVEHSIAIMHSSVLVSL